MSGLDLAALTEAVHARLATDGGAIVSWSMDEDGEPTERDDFVSGSLSAVVRAALEALPREYSTSHDHKPPSFWWERPVDGSLPEECREAGCVRVWRAVGPPIPAEEADPRGPRHVLQPKPPGAGGGRVPGVGWMCSGCEWRFSYDDDESHARVVWQNDERHALLPVPAEDQL